MKQSFFKLLIIICSTLFVNLAFSEATSTGEGNSIDNIRIDKSGKAIIQFKISLKVGNETLDNYKTTKLSVCGTDSESENYHNSLAIDTRTESGRAQLSAALSAQAANRKVVAKGTGVCDLYPVVESVNVLVIH